ncbi:flagellar biosynthesis protein FlhB [Maricaulis sp. D1M11]|uniref:EscU/YscU/HrcU family type III secretion system export apparatus switch protein n=1 Tax=Maricaulis sp. D1M11 TaxID=3076117 RepID=UPI0039B5F2D4
MAESEQNKTEEATPFKLRRARERGMVARGIDLGFFASLTGVAIFGLVAGERLFGDLVQLVRQLFVTAIAGASDPQIGPASIAMTYMPAIKMLALLGGTIVLVVIVFEVIQIRGIVFSTRPLKPEFSRLNPGKGIKRLFSFRMLKETLKNVVKMAAYTLAALLVISLAVQTWAENMGHAGQLVQAIRESSFRLLFVFIVLAAFFTVLDQIIARAEFRKEMRMSKSELKREIKDREGDPRIKQKRKQLHQEFAKQQQSLGELPGSDVLLVNPQHYAVALAYDPAQMSAPLIRAKGRNQFAQTLKRSAIIHGVPIIENPPLARAIFRHGEIGQPIRSKEFKQVAEVYIHLSRQGVLKEKSTSHV